MSSTNHKYNPARFQDDGDCFNSHLGVGEPLLTDEGLAEQRAAADDARESLVEQVRTELMGG